MVERKSKNDAITSMRVNLKTIQELDFIKTGCCVNYWDLEVPRIRKQGLYITRGVSHCGLAIYIKKYL
jgi:hypothetical protein